MLTCDFPFVSVVTPTYNRQHLFRFLVSQYDAQNYPADKRELIVLDDSLAPLGPEFEPILMRPDIQYHWYPMRLSLGKKRNMLNDLAQGDIILCMDDDDYQCVQRITHSVETLKTSDGEIAGASTLYVHYKNNENLTNTNKTNKTNTIYRFGPYGPNHATAGTMAYKTSLARRCKYPEDVPYGEESLFTNNFTIPLLQLDPMQTIVCVSHETNTFDKRPLKVMAKETTANLTDFNIRI